MNNDPNDTIVQTCVESIYEAFEGDEDLEEYCARHGVKSAGILTVLTDEHAALVADYLADRIRGKVVIEIGAGIGLLACHLADYAFKVYAIEANPLWASCFAVALMKKKPLNVTYILGAASEMEGILRGDVALFCTHSGADSMREAGAKFAPSVIDVYADLMGSKFDKATNVLRRMNRMFEPAARSREGVA